MVDNILYELVLILPYLAIVSGILILLKLYLFVTNKTSSWKLFNFFFFNHRHIETSFSQSGKKNKEIQNLFSIAIAILIILSLVGLMIQRSLVT
ncbi:MAG: hypothetical protein LH478_15170 [Chitinophagaceae bacterium]|nr:hypothetical protein [Chitinophagaceae bacterium]